MLNPRHSPGRHRKGLGNQSLPQSGLHHQCAALLFPSSSLFLRDLLPTIIGFHRSLRSLPESTPCHEVWRQRREKFANQKTQPQSTRRTENAILQSPTNRGLNTTTLLTKLPTNSAKKVLVGFKHLVVSCVWQKKRIKKYLFLG